MSLRWPNLNHRLVAAVLAATLCFPANAANCEAGYYPSDGACTSCTSGYYCPGNDTKVQCPRDTNDWYAIFTSEGYEVIRVGQPAYWSWGINGGPVSAITNCHIGFSVQVSTGSFYMEPVYTGTRYDTNRYKLWNFAASGYYLSPYSHTSNTTWYSNVKPCTNAPAHAHYTGAGTPDAPDGSVKDANDCPWECDDGYGLHNNECVPLCATGMQQLKTSNGLQFNLYPVAYSNPALHVKRGNTICYGVLVQGSAANSININHKGKIYHMMD